MKTASARTIALRTALAATLAASGYIHAQLYITGYRYIHVIGVMFLLQASASFAIAALLLIGDPPLIRLAAAGAAGGALTGFAASRTTGVFGFVERGLQPSPQSLQSILVETATLLLLAPALIRTLRRLRASRRQDLSGPRRSSGRWASRPR
ncbi:hypothetical protein [Streptacidiphilus sp. EB129]|uniref:hypothetical protein n=1 Tax=Streptacidiphilus sp. EB129 TaxID=3156262 RepID=UPI003515CA13